MIKKIIIICLALLILAVAGILVADKLIPSRAASKLPESAADVQESYESAGMNMDFTRCLKARISQEEYEQYVSDMELKTAYDWKKHSEYPIYAAGGCEAEWWDSPTNLEGAYFNYKPGDDGYKVCSW